MGGASVPCYSLRHGRCGSEPAVEDLGMGCPGFGALRRLPGRLVRSNSGGFAVGALQSRGGRRVVDLARPGCSAWLLLGLEERAAWPCSFIVVDSAACGRWIMRLSILFGVALFSGCGCVGSLLFLRRSRRAAAVSELCSVRVFLLVY